ncbi:aminoglycoside phosphotransferase family protein [Pseudaminobacter sp. 19-2017]|uniref:Aminoglycoside phosphotransferase family protein n=1 Tax=Pseudaminobacter soli (ex Zhang et al. 2022) TaxID=2831468 RepID=A0A942I923_9HYPH|nr:aminoglycoside phosphotransferase family protein [Pseudaminobacter soli]MBS3649925.1 aminoglycoside phosphotransferase family protein [Pseudaminobacter soli]
MILAAPKEVPYEIRRAICTTFPELADAKISVVGKGWHSLAVEAAGFLFKFPEGEEAIEALEREARLLAAVRPRVQMAVPDMSIHGGPPLFSRHRMLPGRTLEAVDYAALDAAHRDFLARDLALFFGELHALDRETMVSAGALPIGVWDTSDLTLATAWPVLPEQLRSEAKTALRAYRDLGPDPLGASYGFFDAHGWNMAFDRETGRLNGIFDFADSGFGDVHREFVQVSLVDADLAGRTIAAYEELTGKSLDSGRVFLLTAAMRLSELAGSVETGEHVEAVRALVLDWFAQTSVR